MLCAVVSRNISNSTMNIGRSI